jgi:hypothetical protein
MPQFSNFGPYLLNNIKGNEPPAMWLVSFYSIIENQADWCAKFRKPHVIIQYDYRGEGMPGLSKESHT